MMSLLPLRQQPEVSTRIARLMTVERRLPSIHRAVDSLPSVIGASLRHRGLEANTGSSQNVSNMKSSSIIMHAKSNRPKLETTTIRTTVTETVTHGRERTRTGRRVERQRDKRPWNEKTIEEITRGINNR
jgi:hypothetical protein